MTSVVSSDFPDSTVQYSKAHELFAEKWEMCDIALVDLSRA